MSAGKAALVLSAGGMFGAYQAGVWKALYPVFRPDIVVGVSAGSLNAWAIAGGAPPEELEAIWRDRNCVDLARTRRTLRPWQGLFNSDPLHERIRTLWAAYRPQVRVGVTAVELRGLRTRLFKDGEIGWKHLAASCAILFGYAPVRIGDRYYTDGGLVSVLPVWAAVEMGADRIVAVNCLPRMPSATVRLAVNCARVIAPRCPPIPDSVKVCMASPDSPLGTVREALNWQAGTIERWISQGVEDGARLVSTVEWLQQREPGESPIPPQEGGATPTPEPGHFSGF